MKHNNNLFLIRVEFNAKFAFLKEQLASKKNLIDHNLFSEIEYNEATSYYTKAYIREAKLLIRMYNTE